MAAIGVIWAKSSCRRGKWSRRSRTVWIPRCPRRSRYAVLIPVIAVTGSSSERRRTSGSEVDEADHAGAGVGADHGAGFGQRNFEPGEITGDPVAELLGI